MTSSSKPVVRTTRPVVAMVVASAPSHGTAPSTSATTSSSAIAQVVRPRASPTSGGQQHRHDRRRHLLRALGEGPVDGGVHDQQRGPRRQERLRQVQHARGDHPCDDGRQHGLAQLEDVVPPDRVTNRSPTRHPGPGSSVPSPPGDTTALASVRRHPGRGLRWVGDSRAGKSSYDVVVVGGGHNGLVSAAYLARAGLSRGRPRAPRPHRRRRGLGRAVRRASPPGSRATPTS